MSKVFLMKKRNLCQIIVGSLLISALSVPSAAAKDFYIVAIGDSMTSGEGAPDVRANANGGDAVWLEDPVCHRSRMNYADRAVQKLQDEWGDRHRIIYKNFACSGATISEGILGTQEKSGIDVKKVPIRPQVEQVQDWMQEQGIDKLDAIIMSVGINDIQFASAVQSCLSPIPGNCVADFVETLAPYRSIVHTGYRSMNLTLSQKLNPEHVFVMEYPDPLRNQNGQFCDRFDDGYAILAVSSPFFGKRLTLGGLIKNVDRTESSFAFSRVLNPLNEDIRSHSEANGWTYVSGTMRATQRHGYCASGTLRFFNHFNDSVRKQGQHDLTGALHPNDQGYEAVGEVLFEQMQASIQLPVESPLPNNIRIPQQPQPIFRQ